MELRQAENKVIIEGFLSENKLEVKTAQDGTNRKYISGDLLIEVNEGNVVPVSCFSYELTNAGEPNKVYKSLLTVMNDYKSIASHGRDQAEKVRITSGELNTNEFYSQDGRLISYFRIRTNFINRVSGQFTPRAEFQVEVFIGGIKEEIKNDEETGRKIIKAVVPMYGGKVSLFDFIAENEKAIQFIESNYSAGDTVKLAGMIVNSVKINEKVEDTGFGDPIVTKTTTTVRELIATSGTLPVGEKSAFDSKAIREALTKRQASLDELKNKQKKQEAKKASGNDFGF